jgi:thiamine biosynthesis lipoprotein
MVVSATNVYERVVASLQESTATSGGMKFGFKAMGTWCQVTVGSAQPTAAEGFKAAVPQWVANFEARYSRFIPDSIIGQINAAAGKRWVQIDEATDRLFSMCEELVFFTRGAFDPTALPLIKLWNWKAVPPVIPDAAAVAAARELVGWDKVQRRPGAIFLPREGMSIDLGGIGKEYAVDCVVQLAQLYGVANMLVDFGQDIRAVGQPPKRDTWYVGLEDPKQPGTCWAGVAVKDMAVATSGDYLRCFEKDGRRYGHIVDPRTGYPVQNGCQSVSVIAPTCTAAGILSTTAFVLGAKEGINLIEGYCGAEGCITTEYARSETRRFANYVASQS